MSKTHVGKGKCGGSMENLTFPFFPFFEIKNHYVYKKLSICYVQLSIINKISHGFPTSMQSNVLIQ